MISVSFCDPHNFSVHILQFPELGALKISICHPLNRLVLEGLADVDPFAAMALTDTSSSLRHFIFDEVIAFTRLIDFLRRHNYALHHDLYHGFLSNKETRWLLAAFEAVRQRHGKKLYEAAFDLLDPLFKRIPVTAFLLDNISSDISFPGTLTRRGRPTRISLDDLEIDYDLYFRNPFMQNPENVHRCIFPAYFSFSHTKSPQKILGKDLLFCKRYISDFMRCSVISEILPELRTRDDDKVMKAVTELQDACETKSGIERLKAKACLKGCIKENFSGRDIGEQVFPFGIFQACSV